MNKHQWEAEQVIEPPMALRLIQEQFPGLNAKHIRYLSAGWDNTAFIIDEERIFRFPRRAIALPLLEAEWHILPKLHLPLSTPVPEWKGSPTAHFPWPFIGYRMLPGFTACHANLTEEERAAFAQPLARFLAALHAISTKIVTCPIYGDNKGRIDGDQLTLKIRKNYRELELLGLLENKKGLESLLEHLQGYRAPLETTLVHGDFYVRHLLVDEKHHLCGVIDWGDVHIGDPAIDLAIAHSFLPKNAHESFMNAYGEISPETWNLARLRALYSSSLLILFGYHSGDPTIMREGLRSLRVMAES